MDNENKSKKGKLELNIKQHNIENTVNSDNYSLSSINNMPLNTPKPGTINKYFVKKEKISIKNKKSSVCQNELNTISLVTDMDDEDHNKNIYQNDIKNFSGLINGAELKDRGTIYDVPTLGNCGYLALMKGLVYLKKHQF